jgi:hypothetical protein
MFLIVTVPSIAGAQHTIREQVRTMGVSEEIVVADYPSMPLSALTSAAGAVVHVAVRSSDTFLSSDGMAILTDYRVSVVDVLKDGESRLDAGDVVTIRRIGGVLKVDGRTVFSSENQFPTFATGGEYLLFLKTDAGQPFEMLAGPQSAFRVNDGSVAQMGESSKRSSVLMPAFIHEVRELLSAQPQTTAQR